MASNKMTKQSLVNYIQEQVENLHKLYVLKEQKENIQKEIRILEEGKKKKDSKYSEKAKEFISKKMSKMADEDKPQDQKVAIAMSMAREKGLKVPAEKKSKKRIDENELSGNPSFDGIFNELFSIEPEYDYKIINSMNLSPRYHSRRVYDGETTATLYSDELSIKLIITYNNYWEEDPDGASGNGKLSMSYDYWGESDNSDLNTMLSNFQLDELINSKSIYGGIGIETVKRKNMINEEFMSLLSDETKQKLYNQIELLINEHNENQDFSD
jgi:hypothetical protein